MLTETNFRYVQPHCVGCLRMNFKKRIWTQISILHGILGLGIWLNNLSFVQKGFDKNRFNNLNFPGWKKQVTWQVGLPPPNTGVSHQVISRTWGDLCMPVCPETGEVVGDFLLQDWYGWTGWWQQTTRLRLVVVEILPWFIRFYTSKRWLIAWFLNHQPGGTPPKGYKWAENPWGFHWGQINPTYKGALISPYL